MPVDGSAELLSQQKEFVKVHTVFNGSGLPTDIYTAPKNAPNGAPCTRVRYFYHSTYTTSVEYMSEELSTWNSSWEQS